MHFYAQLSSIAINICAFWHTQHELQTHKILFQTIKNMTGINHSTENYFLFLRLNFLFRSFFHSFCLQKHKSSSRRPCHEHTSHILCIFLCFSSVLPRFKNKNKNKIQNLFRLCRFHSFAFISRVLAFNVRADTHTLTCIKSKGSKRHVFPLSSHTHFIWNGIAYGKSEKKKKICKAKSSGRELHNRIVHQVHSYASSFIVLSFWCRNTHAFYFDRKLPPRSAFNWLFSGRAFSVIILNS